MNLETLQTMSDAELNKLAAIKILWNGVVNVPSDNWTPTTDMNDAMKLTQHIDDSYKRHFFVEALRKVQGWHADFVGNEIMYALIQATPRQRTIAAILAKE